MKKISLLIVTAFFLAAQALWGQTQIDGTDLFWQLENGTLTISGTGAMPDWKSADDIPWVINLTAITTLVIENGVTSIGNYAFANCNDLESVTIPGSVTSIGDDAFDNCYNLTGTLTIPEGVQSIGNSAFASCSGLESVTIPGSVTSIGSSAFANCSDLTGTLIIPEGVKSIGSYAFASCSGLESVTIPGSVTDIGDHVFKYCMGLTSFDVCADNAIFCSEDGVLFSKDKKTLLVYPCNKAGIACSIPAGVITIGDSAFEGYVKLTSVTIPGSVTSIGNDAFSNCSGLTGTLTIPDGVESIGNFAFAICRSLESVTIPGSVTSIGDNAFCYCTGLASFDVRADNTVFCSEDGVLFSKDKKTLLIYPSQKKKAKYSIPAGVTTIGYEAFANCELLVSVTIPGSVTRIGDKAFFSSSNLKSITIPDGVTHIGYGAFFGCTNLRSVIIPGSVTSIDGGAFGDCGLKSITVQNASPGNIALDYTTFWHINNDCVLKVPAEAVAAYQNDWQWGSNFRNIKQY